MKKKKKKREKRKQRTLNAFKRERFDPCKASSTVPRFRYRFVSLSYFRPPFSPFSPPLLLSFYISSLFPLVLCVHTWCVHVDNEFPFFSFPLTPSMQEIFFFLFKNFPLLSLTDNHFEFPKKKETKNLQKEEEERISF